MNAIHVWGIARAFGGRVVLRIEDHDRMRCRPTFERALLEDLAWLGLEPDEGTLASYADLPGHVVHRSHPLRQSDNGARYGAALARIDVTGGVYPCSCTRRDIAHDHPHDLGHDHAHDHAHDQLPDAGEERRYPNTCRSRAINGLETVARRVRLDGGEERFDDLRLGAQVQTPMQQCGDVLVRDRHGNWTYQFAVTVDDAEQGIDVVIRGEDLLASTGRQLQLARMLGRVTPPQFLHHVLLMRPDGAKLSKASHDTTLRQRRATGATPERLLGEAAHLAGLLPVARALEVAELPELFTNGKNER